MGFQCRPFKVLVDRLPQSSLVLAVVCVMLLPLLAGCSSYASRLHAESVPPGSLRLAQVAVVVPRAEILTSDFAVRSLQASGISNVAVLEGGFRAWKREAEGEHTLEFRIPEINNIRDAINLQTKLELLPGVRMAGVSSDGLTVVRGITTLEKLKPQLENLGYSLEV